MTLDKQNSPAKIFRPHATCTLQLLDTPCSHRFKFGSRKQLQVSICYFWLTGFIRHGEDQAMRCHFEQVRKDLIQVFFGEMFEYMQRCYCIKRSYHTEIISQEISLNVANVGEMFFSSNFLPYPESIGININSYSFTHEWHAFGE